MVRFRVVHAAARSAIRAVAPAIVGAVVLLTPAAATAAPADAAAAPRSQSLSADVDSFSYASWDSRFELGLDDEGRARMHVTETLTARFPDVDQNKGVVRGMPTTYDNAWLDVTVLSVTDENGAAVPYETDEEDGLLLVLTGDDDYVHGLTTYVIEYEMRDVILAADSGVDEFYWDLLPLDSTQPIESFRADISVDQSLADRATGHTGCYLGAAGSTEECTLVASPDGTRFTVEATDLAAGEGVTAAIGFTSGSAVQPDARRPNAVTDAVPAGAAVGALALSAGAWVAVSRYSRSRRKDSGIVIAQYDVPDSMPPLLAAAIVPGAIDAVPAEIVHLAVRGSLRIEEGEEPEQPRLRLLPGAQGADPLDEQALDSLFAESDDAGVVDIPSASESFAARMSALTQSGAAEASTRGLTTTARSRTALILQVCAIAVVLIGFGLGLWGIIAGRVTALPAFVAIAVGVFLVAVSSFYAFAAHRVLTADGAREYERLMGVKEFIRVAEADRLQMLQSYSGAERTQEGSADVIVVYERLLPYAMLFGMEREWGAVLESAYAHAHRDASWIGEPGSPFLTAQLAAFTMSSGSAATYAAPSTASSSSAGGSFGGGFSGGGGGGGFSGGR